MTIGFSTGCLYKTVGNVKEALKIFQKYNFQAVELMLLRPKEFNEQIGAITREDLQSFAYVSLHSPKMEYTNNKTTRGVFKKIIELNKKVRSLDLVVFHPDMIKDFSIFQNVEFNYAFENMDNRATLFTRPEDFQMISTANPDQMFVGSKPLVLDVNHAYSHDPTGRLAERFWDLLGSRIRQVHISGYYDGHCALFKSLQLPIVNSVMEDVPIIIESVLDPDEITDEFNYIIQHRPHHKKAYLI